LRLFSRKNSVFLVEEGGNRIVRKQFRSRKAFLRELEVLSYLKGKLEVPAVLGFRAEANELYLEYISGDLLSKVSGKHFLDGVALASEWMRKLHFAGLAKGDCNPRNFILSGSRIYGVDFEEAKIIVNGGEDQIKDLVDLASTSALVMVSGGNRAEKALDSILEAVQEGYGKFAEPADEVLRKMAEFLRRRMKYRPEKSQLFSEVIEAAERKRSKLT